MHAEPPPKPSVFVRHRVAIASATLALAVLVAMLASLPLVVRAKLRARVEGMQARVEVDSVRLGWGAIWLRGVRLTVPAIPRLQLELKSMRVTPNWSGQLRALDVAGGKLTLEGELQRVQEQVERWRAGAPAAAASSAGSRAELNVSGIEVQWLRPLGKGSELHLWGLRGERHGERETLGCDLSRVQAQGTSLDANDAQLVWLREGQQRVLQSLQLGSVQTSMAPGGLAALLGQSSETGDSPADAPTAREPQEQKSSPWQRWQALRARVTRLIERHTAPDAVVKVPRIQTHLRLGDQALNIGPARLEVERNGSKVRANFAPDAEASSETLALSAELPLDAAPTVLSLSGGPVGLDTLGVHEGDLGLQRVRDIRVSARSVFTLPADRSPLAIAADGQLENLAFLQAKLAAGVVNTDRIGWGLHAKWDPDAQDVRLEQAHFELDRIKSTLAGTLYLDPENPGAALKFEIPLVSCQDLFDSVPSSLLPGLGGTRLQGTFSLSAALDVRLKALADMKFDWSVQNDCHITAVRQNVAPERFRRPFQYPIYDSLGMPLVRESGPMTRDWVSFAEISPYLETAVIICEDSRFFSHHGIDEKAIESAIVDNVRAGRFVRGASTITMQLAKNLYLGHEKTLSRKLQEAVLTVVLEQELSKQEILELYFNVIEFGPDVWGIKAAAEYYFSRQPSELTLAQSLYLASILPSPGNPHALSDGTLSEKWSAYLHKLMHIAHKIHRINDEELKRGLEETVRVGLGRPLPPLPGDAQPPLAEEPDEEPGPPILDDPWLVPETAP